MVVKINNIKSQVIIEAGDPPGLRDRLSNHLSVLVSGRHFVEAFRRGSWDGRERFLTRHNQFPTGLFPSIKKFCSYHDISLSVQDERGDLPVLPNNWDYDLDAHLTLREYQKDIIEKLYINTKIDNLWFVRGIINAATNAGKDYVMASIYKNINVKTLLIIHNTEIYRKAVNFFSEYFEVGEISARTFNIKHFTIAMQKSLLYAANKDITILKYLSEIKCLFVDEGHRAAGKEYQLLLSKINSPIRLLFSGTPLEMDDDAKKFKLVGSFGPELVKIKNEFLIKEGFSQKPIIDIYDANNSIISFDYRDEYERGIIYSKNRVNIISKICKEEYPNKQILISFTEIEHGKFMLDNLLLSGLSSVDSVSGEDVNREQKIEDFKNSKLRILLSSMILKEGVNIPNIQILILAHGGKSRITIKQYIGRALRHDGKSNTVKIIDFYDRGNNISKHSKDRISLYKKEGFEINYNYQHNKLNVPV